MNTAELDQYLRSYSASEVMLKGAASDGKTADLVISPDVLSGKFLDEHFETVELNKLREWAKDGSVIDLPHFRNTRDLIFLVQDRFCATPRHKHVFVEMQYVYSGECHNIINGKPVHLSQGDVCIFGTNAYHSIYCPDENDIVINCLMSTEYFRSTFLDRLSGNDILSAMYINEIFERKDTEKHLVFHHTEAHDLHALVTDMLCEYYNKAPGYSETVTAYMVILFSRLLRIYMAEATENQRRSGTYPLEILRYIQENCATATLAGTAAQFGYEPTYVSKLLKRHLSKTFLELRNDARLEKTCQLLADPSKKIDQIASEVGFSNLHYFYQAFKEKYAMTPAQYRKTRFIQYY